MRNTYLSHLRTRWLFALAFLLLPWVTRAQVANYTFSQSIGTYTPITGGTVPTGGTATDNSSTAGSLDDVVWNLPNGTIPFTFTFNGTGYTGLNINSNGYITFGATAPSTTGYTPISATTAYAGAVAAFGRDMNAYFAVSSLTGQVRYETVGSSPNREFVIQFSNFRRYSTSATLSNVWNAQIRLAETTNEISIVYNAYVPVGGSFSNPDSVQVGLRGAANTDFHNRTTWNASMSNYFGRWTTSGKGVINNLGMMWRGTTASNNYPPAGLTYTFAPGPGTCGGSTTPTFSALTGVVFNGATLNWSAVATATSYNVRYKRVIDSANAATWTTPITGIATNTTTLTGLSASTVYEYQVQAVCPAATGQWTSGKNRSLIVTPACPTDLIPNAVTAPAVSAANCYGTTETITVQIRNNGSGALNFATNPVTVTLTTTGPNPQTYTQTISTGTLAVATNQSVVMTTTYDMSGAGTHGMNASVNMTGDCNTTNDVLATVNYTSAAGTSLVSPYFADFEPSGTLPTGWTNTSYSAISGAGNPGYAYRVNHFSATAKSLVTNTFQVNAATDSLRFDWKLTDDAAGTIVQAGTFGSIAVEISTTCGASWTNLGTINTSSTTYTTFKRDLASYVGQKVQFRLNGAWVANDWYFFVDNFVIGPVPPKQVGTIASAQTTGTILQGANNNAVIRIDIPVQGQLGTLTLDALTALYSGTTPLDVTNAKLYRTPTTTFNTSTLVATVSLSGSNATFTGLSEVLNTGANYFWLAVDVPLSGATFGNTVDFQVNANQITVSASGGATAPGSTPALVPAGNRTIGGAMLAMNVARSTGITYTPLTGGTVLYDPTSTAVDDNTGAANLLTSVSPAFAFSFAGTPVTGIYVSNNGYVQLNSNTGMPSYTNVIGSTAPAGAILAPFYEDLYMPIGSAGRVRWAITGTSPNRVLTVEWFNEEVYNYPGPDINFQVKMVETTNQVIFDYGVMQGFNGTNPSVTSGPVPNGLAFNYSVGLRNFSVSSTPAPGEVFAAAYENSASAFTHLFSNVANRGLNMLNKMPDCNSRLTFTPGTGYTYVPNTTPFAAPSNDDAGGAVVITPLPAPAANYCGSFYSSLGATQSMVGCTGNADDDVWFTFNAISSSTNISVRPSGGYDAVVEVLDASLAPLSPAVCRNANNLTGANLAEDFSVPTVIGNDYYVRVYHVGGGTTAIGTANLTSGAVSSVTINNGGSGYISSYGGVLNPTQWTKVFLIGGNGTGAAASVTALTSGAVSTVTIDNGGSGYTVAPTVVFQQPGAGVTGDFALQIYATPDQPANDNTADAKTLTVNGGGTCTPSFASDLTFGAQNEDGRGQCAGVADDDVWYKFTAANNRQHLVSITGTNGINYNLQVYDAGAAPGDTTTWVSIGCGSAAGVNGTETLSFVAVSGRTYYARVFNAGASYGAANGRFSICAYSVPPMGYEFAQSVGTYTPITGGTDLTSNFSSFDSDTTHIDVTPGVLFNGQMYTRVYIGTNGWISLGNGQPAPGTTNAINTAIGDAVLQPMGRDLDESIVNSVEMRYQLVGNEHVFQWAHWSYWLSGDEDISFQIRANHVTGQIRFVYDSVDAGTYTSTNAVVGIRGTGTTYPDHAITRVANDAWEKSTTGGSTTSSMPVTPGDPKLFPTTGLTYQFTPTPCLSYPLQPPVVAGGDLGADQIVARWNIFAGASNGYYIRWRKPTDPLTVTSWATPTAVGSGTTDTSFTITGLTPTTAYIFDVAGRCDATNKTNFSGARSFTTTAPPFDARISAVTPTGSACQGSVPVTVTILNQGTSAIAASEVLPITVSWTGAASGSVTINHTVVTPIAPAGTLAVTVGTGTFSVAGTYNMVAHVDWTNDQDLSNDTTTQSFSASPVYTAPYSYGFNGTLSTDYTMTIISPTTSTAPADIARDGWRIAPGQDSPVLAPQEGSDVITMACTDLLGDQRARLYTPCFNIANACSEFRFWFAQANGTSTAEETDIYMSVDGGAYALVNVKKIGDPGSGSSRIRPQQSNISGGIQWVQYYIDLSAYNGNTLKFAFEGHSAFGGIDMSIDNVSLFERPANDLGISAQPLPLPPPSCASSLAPVQVSIKNYGCSPQSNIPVQVVVTGPVSQTFNDVYTGTINPGAIANITLGTINTVAQGTYTFTSTTQMIGDGDATNDQFVYTLNVTAANAPPVATATANPANILTNTATVLSGTTPVDIAGGTFVYTSPFTFGDATGDTLSEDAPTLDAVPNFLQKTLAVSGLTGRQAATLTRVRLNMRHTFRGDMRIYLYAPDGSRIRLIGLGSSTNSGTGRGGTGNDFRNLDLVTSGPSISTITATTSDGVNFTTQYTPEQPFGNLTGAANGNWELRLVDSVDGDGGRLNGFTLEFAPLTISRVWSITSPPSPIAGWAGGPTTYTFNGNNPGSKTLVNPGAYNFTFTATYSGGCGQTLPVTVNVFEGNQWLGVDNTNPNNNWQNTANWAVAPAPPLPGTAVSIPAGTPFQPTVDQATVVGNLTIANGATLTVNGSGSLTINGAIRGNSLANVQGVGPVTIGGTGTQRITGAVILNSLTVTNTDPTGLTFNPGGKLMIRPGGTLTMGANARITIPADGELVLMSNNTGTARLGVMPASALIIGELSLQRQLPTSTGWYFASAPFKAATANLNEWEELPARVAPVNNANIFEYTETNSAPVLDLVGDTVATSGWRPPSARTNPINPSDKPKGYRVYQNASLISRGSLLTVRGNPITQNVVTNFTFTPTSPGGYDGGGWNLLANPYPSEIDWNAVKFDPTNTAAPSGNAVHIYNGVSKVYGSWTATGAGTGVAVNGASRYIASSQAFFVKATAAGSITFKESHKNAVNPNTFLRTEEPSNLLKFTFSQGGNQDEAAVLFMTGATAGLDTYDANNLIGDNGVDAASGQNLAINVMPELTQREVIPMGFKAGVGQAKVTFQGTSSFPTTARVYLRDNYLGTLTEVIDGAAYSFSVSADPASSSNARFELVFEPTATGIEKVTAMPTLSAWPNPVSTVSQELNVQMNNFGTGKAAVVLIDVLGKPVYAASADLSINNNLTIKLSGMPAGVYTLKAASGDIAMQKQIVVE